MSDQLSFTVGSQTDLNNAIATIEGEGNGPAAYTITLSSDITEGDPGQPAGIDAISLASGASLVIDGAGHAIDGGGVDGGLAVLSGKVTIESLTIEDTVAQGGAGQQSGGGGAGLGGGLYVGSTARVTAQGLTFRTDAADGGNGGTGGGGGVGGNFSPIVLPLGIAGAQGMDGADAAGTGGAGGTGGNGGNGGFGQPGGDGGAGGAGGAGMYNTHAAGGIGGSAGKAGNGGSGGVGGHGGSGGAGGDAGAGAVGGHGTFTVNGSMTTTNSHGGPGFAGGDDGTPGDGGKGGGGGLGGGGGGGGSGGGVILTEAEVVIAGYAGGPGGEGGGGARTSVPFMGTRGGHGTAQGPGQTGGAGGNGTTGGNGGAGGSGGFGGGGGGGGNGADGSGGGEGGRGGTGAESYYGLDGYANGPLPTPSAATDGGKGGDGGDGGNGGTGAAGGFGGFGGGGGGGGAPGSGGEAGGGGQGGAGGLAFTSAIYQARTFPSLNGKTGANGASGSPGADGSNGGAGQPGGFGAGGGANGSQGGAGGGGLGAGGDIFVAQGGTLLLDGGLLSGGTVAGGTGAAPGMGFGAGIFLQGNETITLAATAAQALTISDVIADVLGSGGTQGAGRLAVSGTGTVDLAATNTFVGGITLEQGTLELGSKGAAGAGPIVFAPSPDPTLTFSATDAPANALEDFGPGGEIDITGFLSVLYGYTAGRLTLQGSGGNQLVLDIPGHALADFFVLADPATDQTFITSAVACYAAGTLIMTHHGERPVEHLAIGDIVVTAADEPRPIRWLGHRTYAGRFLAANPAAQPIRFCAGSLGDGVPRRDLLVSPEHAMFLDGVLVPARHLVNGATIRPAHLESVTYFHVELASHDVLLAEGAPSESFLDDDSRALFHNAAQFTLLYPVVAAARPVAVSCARRVEAGQELEVIRQRLGRIGRAAAAA